MSLESIKQYCLELSTILFGTAESNLSVNTFDINCSELPDARDQYAEEFELLKPIFDRLTEINTIPVLYWVEILSSQSTLEIYDAHKVYKELREKATPAIKKYYPKDSRVLYVGKVKRDIRGRVYVHLGYYHNPYTQGLQLYHWAREFGLNVRFNYVTFAEDMAPLVVVLESLLAKELQPILGKH